MYFLFSRDTKGSDWPLKSRAYLLSRSVTWRDQFGPPRFWRTALKKEPWLRRLSGAIYAPSTARRIVAEWISSQPVTRVRISALPENGRGSTDGAANVGNRYGELLAYASPGFASWKTCQATLALDLSESCLTLPNAGTMRNGRLYRREIVATRKSESGCFVWPTPAARDWRSGEASDATMEKHARPLSEIAANWNTPNCRDGDKWHNRSGGRQQNLSGQTFNWPTPKSSMPGSRINSRGGKVLEQEARSFRQAPATPKPGPESSPNAPTSPRRLNPKFVEWLMGLPEGWTDCGCSAMALSRFKRRWLLSRCAAARELR